MNHNQQFYQRAIDRKYKYKKAKRFTINNTNQNFCLDSGSPLGS
ncbi:hypothetical protein [Pseudalkalibacillus hwajinpoensis]|nr:hypothetical protein [Pseudalkalibacillus hwajinpoensis]